VNKAANVEIMWVFGLDAIVKDGVSYPRTS